MESSSSANESSYLPQIAKGAMINFVGVIARIILIYAYTLFLARILSGTDFGSLYLMSTMISILGAVALLGLDFGVVRYVALYHGERKYGASRDVLWTGLKIALPWGLSLGIGFFLFAPLMAALLFNGSQQVVTALRIYSLFIPLWMIAQLFNSATRGIHRMQYQVISRDVGEQLSKIILVAVIMIFFSVSITRVVWANVIALIIATVLSGFFVIKAMPHGQIDEPRQVMFGKMFWYSLPLAFSNILVMLLAWMDTLFLAFFRTQVDVGIYGAVVRVTIAIGTIMIAFGNVFTPAISDLFNRKKLLELTELFRIVTRWMFVSAYIFFLIVLIFSDSIMGIFGKGFTIGGSALMMISLGQLMGASIGPADRMLLMSGRSKIQLLNVGTTLIINIILCLLLIPPYGIMGAATANMASLVTINLFQSLEVWFLMRIQPYDCHFIKPLVAGLLTAIIIGIPERFLLPRNSIAAVFAMIIFLVIIYFLISALLGIADQDMAVLRMVRMRIRGVKAA
ncbi:MAG: flippase [Thermoleophilia bacterium]